jgi:sirohydrochlorin cobaltochelatase
MTVLLGVAHGSRDDSAQQVVRELLTAVAARRDGLRAEPAYLDNASPSVARAIDALVAQGERDITVVPLLLNAAGHSKTDAAASVQAARQAHPGVTLRYGRPFGAHPAVVAVLAQRLEQAGAVDLPVLLVAGGSIDPDANATVAAVARLLWEGRGFPTVDYAFVSATGPTVTQARARIGGPVALSRYFLGPGYLPDKAAALAGAEVVADVLGAAPELVDLVLERYDEAREGDLRMNCDACLYRVPFAGLADRVGAAQVPHTHPDDR